MTLSVQNPELAPLGNVVPEGYTYSEKLITPAEDLRLEGAWLKWYDLYPADVPITPAQRAEARDFLSGQEAAAWRDRDLGFVILHRAGSVLLLLLTTWRQTNEMWESVWMTKADSTDGYRPVDRQSSHIATYCVWELGAVWHERNAWVRFLSTRRDEAAKRAYLEDRFSGRV